MIISSLYQEAPTGEKQNQTSWGAKVQHQGIAVIFQLQHLEDAESMSYQIVYFTVNIIAISKKPARGV
jgi:hypothetical protein